MHRLMCVDADQFSWFMMYEMFLPSLVQRKLIRLLGHLDRRYWGSAITKRIKAWEDRTFAKGRQMHPMSLTGPEEDEFLMAIPFCSGTVSVIFPYMREIRPYSLFDQLLPESKRKRVMKYYRECVRRQIYLNGDNKIHLSKNPVFSDKVASLIETFPDARFVVLVRNPYETIPSIMKMMERNWKASDCDRNRIKDALPILGENSISAYLHPFDVLNESEQTRWTVVRYEDLVEKPRQTVEHVYDALELPMTEAMRASLLREEEHSREYRADHLYSLEEYGLTRGEIREKLAPLFARFDWDSERDSVAG
jgi:hypothetical protein